MLFFKKTIRMIGDIFVSGVYRACKENGINPEKEIDGISDLNKIFAYVGNLPGVKHLDNVNDVLERSIFGCKLDLDSGLILHPGTIAGIITYLYLINTVVDRLKESEKRVILEKVKEKFYNVDSSLIFGHKID